MKPPCEIVVNKMLPRIRADIVRILTQDYHMKQIDISKRLGITQASVSQYLSLNRGGDEEFHDMFPEIEDYAKAIAERIASGEDKVTQLALLCELCSKIRDGKAFCNYHKGVLQLESCGICFQEPANEAKKQG